jgi:hypothetical protein
MTYKVQIDDLVRDATAEEIAAIESAAAADLARKQVEADKEAAKEAAQAKLEALGLTTDDLKALGL